MEQKLAKHPIQVVLENEEWQVIKTVSVMRHFKSLNLYVKHLIEQDIVEYKKTMEHPWLIGMRKYDWDNLSESEKEKYMKQIGPVKPQSLEYEVKKIRGQVFDGMPLMGHVNDIEL